MFVFSLRLMTDENAIDVDGNSLKTLLKTFLTLVKRLTLLVISLVPTWTMRSSGFSLIITSSFSRIFSLVPPGKFIIFILWLTLRPFSEIPFTMESPVNTIFFLLEGSAWVSIFCFALELGLEFPLSVSTISSFSVTVLFTELVLLLVSFFCFRRTFMIAYFSMSSFSRLNMLFFKISNSNYHYYYKLFFPEMFWSAISSSSNFRLVDFVNRFISSISFRRFWNKTKLCVHSSPGCFTGFLDVGGWANGSSGVLKLFRKSDDSGDFLDSDNMFPDFKIVNKYRCGRTKAKHMLTGAVTKQITNDLKEELLFPHWYRLATDRNSDEDDKFCPF